MTEVVALLFAVGSVAWAVAVFREVHSGTGSR